MEYFNIPLHSEKPVIDDKMNMISVQLRIDYENSINKIIKCFRHSASEISHYCRDCQISICLKCYEQHKIHDTVDRDVIIQEKINNISGTIERFCTIKSDLIDILYQCDQQRKTIVEDQKASYSDIESKFSILQSEIDNCKNQLLMELQQVSESCLMRLETNKKELLALNDDISTITDLTDKNSSAFDHYNLFELEEYAKQKLIHYSNNPLDYLRPNRLNIQVKWTNNSKNIINYPFAKINCFLSPEKFSLLKTLSVININDKHKSYISSVCCDSNDFLYLCDTANGKIKMFNKDYVIDKCFAGSGNHKLICPINIISLSTFPENSTDNNDRTATVLIADPGSQKIVTFNKFGVGVNSFETTGTGEALCLIDNLLEFENCKERFLELSTIYDAMEACGTQDQYLNRPTIILCSKMESLQLEFLQINPRTLKLCKTRSDLILSSNELEFIFSPKCMVWNSKSHLLFLMDCEEHRVVLFSSQDGKFIRTYGRYGNGTEEFDHPTSIIIDRENQVLVADKNNNRIHLLDPMGNFIKFLFDKNYKQVISQPTAICFDNDYNLVVCERDEKMKIFTY